VAALRDDLDAAKAAVANARSRLAPIVDLELAKNNNRDMGGSPGVNNSTSAMLVMRYNLFRGGNDEAKIRETMERETGAQEALNNARRAIEEEVSRAWASMVAARDALRYYELHVKMTEEVLEAFRSQFDIGKRTMLDLMNSENELFQAKSNLTSGQYSLLLAQHRLLSGIGGLTKILGL
jgi:adhesin transport system outer membrane protein